MILMDDIMNEIIGGKGIMYIKKLVINIKLNMKVKYLEKKFLVDLKN